MWGGLLSIISSRKEEEAEEQDEGRNQLPHNPTEVVEMFMG